MSKRIILPSDLRHDTSPRWVKIVCCQPAACGLLATLFTLPFKNDHIGVLLSSVILSGFLYWLLKSLVSARYESRQGCYDRDKNPFKYWIHILILLIAVSILGYGCGRFLQKVWSL
ncbi:MAG: hypothetical protein ACPG6P_06790 [Akkermansiaceae bacterium]